VKTGGSGSIISGDARCQLNFPIVTVLIIAANVVIFLIEQALGDALINRWLLVPADIIAARTG
jgi:membrane associated rhomboid family serine protease